MVAPLLVDKAKGKRWRRLPLSYYREAAAKMLRRQSRLRAAASLKALSRMLPQAEVPFGGITPCQR